MKHARLRPLQMTDLDSIMPWINDPEVVKNFQNFDKEVTREEEQRYLEKMLASPHDKLFAIETEAGEYLGNAGIHDIHTKNNEGRLGLIIGNKKQWGGGYGQSAVRALIQYAFEVCDLHRIELRVFEENAKARHIYQKVGFVEEGVMRKKYADREGKYHDMVLMAMLREDYEARKTGDRK